MTEQMPKSTVVKLRQVSSAITPGSRYPDWFLALSGHNDGKPWRDLLFAAADELEQMQQLNGRLLRRLAGD